MTLKSTLEGIIDGHTVLSYTPGVWEAHKDLYEDPNNSSRIVLFYSQASVLKTQQDSGGSPGNYWNREHLWPRSLGVGNGGDDNTDLHHLVPTFKSVNSERGNKYFDISDTGSYGYSNPANSLAPDCSMDNDSWEPADAQKGQVARAILYMSTRYNYLQLVDTPPSSAPNTESSRMAQLSVLLDWNRKFPPTANERDVNQRIYQDYQGNRNPFTDYPEFADAIWLDGPSWGGWRLQHFSFSELSNPVHSEDSVDPDGDGLSNLMEMALYTNPKIAQTEPALSISKLQTGDSDSSTGTSGLFFSEYAEGSSNNKYLEIYNPTSEAVSLDGYALASVSNAPTTAGEHEFWRDFVSGASIASGEVYVIAHPSSDASIIALADETHSYLSNGDDGYALVEGTETSYTIVDFLGDFQGDPGSAWDVAGVTGATKDKTLVRKDTITSGNSDWDASRGTTTEDSEWIVYDQDTWTYLGAHPGIASGDTGSGSSDSGSGDSGSGDSGFGDSGSGDSGSGDSGSGDSGSGDSGSGDSGSGDTGTGTSGLFFSEYADGSSNNKYLEIYNPTSEAVSLDGYALASVGNAPATAGEHEYWRDFVSGASIASGEVYVIAHPSADESILASANETHTYLSNGNDGYALVFGTEDDYTIVDFLGDFQGDPGLGWDVAGVSEATKDKTLVRKDTITSGNSDWDASRGTTTEDSEWIVYDENTWTYLGAHSVSSSDNSGSNPGDDNTGDNVTPEDPILWITELADPNDDPGSRYLELYSPNGAGQTIEQDLYIVRWTGSNTYVSSYVSLKNTVIGNDGFLVIGRPGATYSELFDYTSTSAAIRSDGDDNIALVSSSDNLSTGTIIDIFGVPGEDGSFTDHEFEDGRAERKASVTGPNPVWDVNEWNIDNDSGGGDGPQNVDDMDPREWIGDNGTIPPSMSEALAVVPATTTGTNSFVVSFSCASDFSHLELSLILEASTDLSNWTEINLDNAQRTQLDSNRERVDLTVQADSFDYRFFRLKAVRNL